jgi:oligosaccharide repeat unit polymerase
MDPLNELSVLPAVGLGLLLLAALVADVRTDLRRLVSGRGVVLVGIASWYLLEAIKCPEELRTYDQAAYNTGLLAVVLALAAFLAGYHYTRGCAFFPALGRQVAFFEDRARLRKIVLIGAAIGFAPVVYNVGLELSQMFQGMFGMRQSWGGLLARQRYGDARAAFLMLEMFVIGVAPFAAILTFERGSPLYQRAIFALITAWPVLRSFGSGTRSALIQAVGPVVAVLYWKARPAVQKRLIIGGLLCAPLFYGLMAAMVISRGEGEFSWEARQKADYVGNEMFRELLFITTRVPGDVDYQYGYSYYVQLVNPIPRFLWPNKPTLDAGILMAILNGEVNADGEAYLTRSPGLIGEMFLNFGWAGVVLLSLLGGWLVKGWDRTRDEWGHSLVVLIFYTAGLATLFIMGRSFTMNMFYGLMSFALLAWVMRQFSAAPAGEAPTGEAA